MIASERAMASTNFSSRRSPCRCSGDAVSVVMAQEATRVPDIRPAMNDVDRPAEETEQQMTDDERFSLLVRPNQRFVPSMLVTRPRVPRMDVRASDAERDATVDRLREAAAEGRLTLEQLTDRIEAAANAVMRSELVPLTSDLPATAAVGAVRQSAAVRGVGD